MNPTAFEQLEELEHSHWWFRGRRRVYLELLRAALAGERPERVLDLGAGVGGFLAELGALGDELHVLEHDAGAARTLVERGAPRLVRADATRLPYASMSFDLVCLFDVLEHVPDHHAALREVQRVLNPQGLAILSVPAHAWLWSENDRVTEHQRRYTRRGLVTALEEAHLVVERCTYANALLFPAIAAFLVLTEAARRVHLAPAGATNLSVPMPRSVDELCYRLFTAELALSRRRDLPLGHSLLAIVRRRDRLMQPVPSLRELTRAAALSVEGSLAGF